MGKDEFGNIEALIQSIRFGSATYHGQWFTNDPSICAEGTLAEATSLENQDGEIVQVAALDAVALQVGVFFGDDGKALGETTDDGDPISAGSSCIGDIADVAGETIAFTTESSTSRYLFPALDLQNLGIDPTADVTPSFSGNHDAAVVAVYNGDAQVRPVVRRCPSHDPQGRDRCRREGDRVLDHPARFRTTSWRSAASCRTL